ncbi:endonuclease/exonuclease/phosphatase family protein [Halorhabdus sp. CBA1104]|uniref:twin-arginine translocation signal domain-containing protein n=1 Tax=unclassified Halorhabdus TaxID=2621901 RepID=UPI0012B307BA|nr:MULTISPECIES: twin-arginine translocation signal domain-containing protein [unclassified Halorhabdus]QGN08050.1 endonuclease/exonuclease/phosphatase family protein [Halorhabdus sp. CBA1104]
MSHDTTRRTFLQGIGATVATAGIAGTASAYEPRSATRFAQFNIEDLTTSQVQEEETSFYEDSSGDEQAAAAAELIQEIRPDVLVINELTNNIQQGKKTDKTNIRAFIDNYLRVPQRDDLDPIPFPYTFQPPVNTGVLPEEDYDFNKDGSAGERPGDAYGFGFYPGQYGMAIASQYPILESDIRTFQEFLWADMPNNLMPLDDGSMDLDEDGIYLTPEETDAFRLSSKTHADIPVRVDGEPVHVLTSHPTPPQYDGPNNFNGRWNHDEVRFWADYVANAEYIYDDDGNEGGLDDDRYVLMGDQNAAVMGERILKPAHAFFRENKDFYTDELPSSPGGENLGKPHATRIRGPRPGQAGDGDTVVGQLDRVLPSPALSYEDGGVVWPKPSDSRIETVRAASDHRMVWADLESPSQSSGVSELLAALRSDSSSAD